ncbi:hypothetical protein LOZ80_13855 [Paenibacillus sp. HWE-109]|uniref:hypothetical protein n=1 Tax=Paenibacillus sp. HWE-109 TaxID=1306526 RepID=UPI001EDCF936|nr:hypothetical protein [Paenibacillus sp. HWE-109]UKS29956.1 hypothetical protein LOZ80_13855 [Paenibacillus sp. HWE-109]
MVECTLWEKIISGNILISKIAKITRRCSKAEINRCGAAAAIQAEEIIRNAATAALPAGIPAAERAGLGAIPLVVKSAYETF